jgi:hypothetical protein
MIDARTQLDRQYHEMRWRILSLAADFDRVERLGGGSELVSKDVRIANLKRCVEELLSADPGRAERVQTILSDKTPPPAR